MNTHMHILLLGMRNFMKPSATSDSYSLYAWTVQSWVSMSFNIRFNICI